MFIPHSYDKGALQPWEYLPAAAGSYHIGMALNVNAGQLTAITAPSKTSPAYICMAEKIAKAGDLLPVQRVNKDVIHETTLSAEAASATIGSKLQVSAGGMQADAAAEGTFEVVYIEGTAAGSIVRGRFN